MICLSKNFVKGSHMSRLDVVETEKSLLEQREREEELIDVNDLLLIHEKRVNLPKEEIDPRDWLEVFEEDQVKLQGCR